MSRSLRFVYRGFTNLVYDSHIVSKEEGNESMASKKDPYIVLGVSRDADEETITAAYRALAKQYHPDLNPGDAGAADRMQEINEAYTYIREHDASFSAQGGGGRSAYSANGRGDATGFWSEFGAKRGQQDAYRLVRRALADEDWTRALALLSASSARDAYWYYFSAYAHRGNGNRMLALHYAKTAHELDPYEPVFEELYDELRTDSTQARAQNEKRAAIRDTVRRVVMLIMALCMVGGVLFQACVN